MKRIFIVIALCCVNMLMYGQTYDETNSLMRKALVLYTIDEKGFYHKQENVNLPIVRSIEDNYAYDKKSHELYVVTSNGNVVITVADNYAKFLKKNKSIPQLKNGEIAVAVARENARLEEKFNRLNLNRQRHIEDSIAKAKEDSIVKAREDSLRLVRLAEQKAKYKKEHDWAWIPVNKESLTCTLCKKHVYLEDSIICMGFRNDTLYHFTSKDVALGVTCPEVHPLPVPEKLKNNEKFKYHFEVYGDSLMKDRFYMNAPEAFNLFSEAEALEKVEKLAPYGYFDSWDWGHEYGPVTFSFRYTNTNKNTIKYIAVHWKISNGVKDVRKTGYFQGTGPLEKWESASWSWDYSPYYVAGDASYMDITKVVITYMNGTQKVLTGSKMMFDD